MTQPSEPRTVAGRALLEKIETLGDAYNFEPGMRSIRASILAIEAEASAPDPVATCDHTSTGRRTINGPDGRMAGAETFCVACGLVLRPDPVASPAPLDVERLARAIDVAWDSEIHQPLHSVDQGRGYFQLRPAPGLPARIAAEYARLEGQPVAEEPRDGVR